MGVQYLGKIHTLMRIKLKHLHLNKFYPFLNNEYVLKFKYLLFEINKVLKNTNKLVMIKLTDKGKYQSIPKKFVTKK